MKKNFIFFKRFINILHLLLFKLLTTTSVFNKYNISKEKKIVLNYKTNFKLKS